MPLIRLQKIISRAGLASLRKAEKMILAGQVAVDGAIVRVLGTKVDPQKNRVSVDGREIGREFKKIYLILNKPAGFLTTKSDPQERPTILEFLKGRDAGLHPVGRLDQETEGLLLFTSDGELTFKLTHPKFEIEKEYLVVVRGEIPEHNLKKIGQGLELEDGRTKPAKVKIISANRKDAEYGGMSSTKLFLTIHEGKKRQIRRMCEFLGNPVLYLKRIRIGPIRLGSLASGQMRALRTSEIKALRRYIAQKEAAQKTKYDRKKFPQNQPDN